jgi:tetratricopeptide (TPR) repeat protein
MTGNTSLDGQLTEAGRLLIELTGYPAFVDADNEDWADDTRAIRELYTQIQRTAPENLEAAVGFAALAEAELRFHMVNHVGTDLWEEGTEVACLPADDGVGRLLAERAAGAAQHVLSLEPGNNLAVFVEGLAHECGGAHEQASRAYRRALQLDPWGDVALTRAQVLDEEYNPARYEGPEPNPHSRHFWLLRSSQLISNAGDEQVEYWRLSDLAEVRAAIKSALLEIEARNPDLAQAWGTDDYPDCQDGDFVLTTYAPRRAPRPLDVYDALRRTSSGGLEVDWTAVDLDEPLPALRLPLGQPVRINGRTYFDGWLEPFEE